MGRFFLKDHFPRSFAQWACFMGFIKNHNYSLYSLVKSHWITEIKNIVKNLPTGNPLSVIVTQYIFFLHSSVFLRNGHLKSVSYQNGQFIYAHCADGFRKLHIT